MDPNFQMFIRASAIIVAMVCAWSFTIVLLLTVISVIKCVRAWLALKGVPTE